MNEYDKDVQGGFRLYQIKAYVHDVRMSSEDPTSESFREDVRDLVGLLDEFLVEQGVDPSYPAGIGRGGLEEEEEDN